MTQKVFFHAGGLCTGHREEWPDDEGRKRIREQHRMREMRVRARVASRVYGVFTLSLRTLGALPLSLSALPPVPARTKPALITLFDNSAWELLDKGKLGPAAI